MISLISFWLHVDLKIFYRQWFLIISNLNLYRISLCNLCFNINNILMLINISDLFLSLIGGVMIGLACSMYYITRGRITGMSGIYYGVITFKWNEFYWKLSILCSIVFSTGLMY